MDCDIKYKDGIKSDCEVKKRKLKYKKLTDMFEVKKTIKCPKGFKVCNCNPKKPKCKKIEKKK